MAGACKPLTQERLRHDLDYEPYTGVFTRKTGPRSGQQAGTIHEGYIRIRVAGRRYRGHRLAFLWMTGEFPSEEVDHTNGARDDNRWANLRPASRSENNCNTAARGEMKGASYHARHKTWQVRVQKHGRRLFVGEFKTKEEAHAAYCRTAMAMHGEFFRGK